MYVLVRVMKVKKGFQDKVLERFLNPSVMAKSKGYVKSELMIDKKNPEYDLYRQSVYWEDKKAFYVWEGSPEHIAMHRDKNSAHHQKPEEIIEVTRESYDLIGTKTCEQ
ncbi:antibiotic biosynthesis monooxygenase family protein [Acholeplasma hippikon]|uniref:Heme-degrading monooxygenase IsdG n=1 Tax=Acholeplasma hippikon TaxID=264636 RepID=A0A449BHV8_9MOLU|nr:antibiotic biosynthesis monooxygenase [Acholeplasma hippikon]VEU82039.1 heme-degrading monooxygenase IsdG [Acholeplasma hippikon]